MRKMALLAFVSRGILRATHLGIPFQRHIHTSPNSSQLFKTQLIVTSPHKIASHCGHVRERMVVRHIG